MIAGITEKEQKIIERILDKYRKDYAFFYYGSRVKGTYEKTSDLDVLIKGKAEMPLAVLQEIKEEFDKSDLPYIVNFSDYYKLDSSFYECIKPDLIPYNWQEVKLGDVCEINKQTYSLNENWQYAYYLDTGNITENKIEEIQFIDLNFQKLPSRAKRKVEKDNIIYSTVRPNQLHYGIIKSKPNNFLVSTGFSVLSVNKLFVDASFIYYFLTQKYLTEKLQAIAEQSVSAYPSIKPSDIANITISLPPLEVQKKIAGVLGALDDKIELNNKINQNLEAQAQALFKSWFVDFEPFGGKMPDDWKIGKLGEIAYITMGQSPNGSSYNEDKQGCIFFQGRAEFGKRFPSVRLYTTEPKRMAKKNDILMSVRAPVGDFNIAVEDCCIGRGLCSIRAKGNFQSFVLYTIWSLQKQLEIFNGEGTVFGAINKDSLNSLPITIPSLANIGQFENIVSSLDNIIRNNFLENTRLAELRDTLLPKLMSGEINVDDVKILADKSSFTGEI